MIKTYKVELSFEVTDDEDMFTGLTIEKAREEFMEIFEEEEILKKVTCTFTEVE